MRQACVNAMQRSRMPKPLVCRPKDLRVKAVSRALRLPSSSPSPSEHHHCLGRPHAHDAPRTSRRTRPLPWSGRRMLGAKTTGGASAFPPQLLSVRRPCLALAPGFLFSSFVDGNGEGIDVCCGGARECKYFFMSRELMNCARDAKWRVPACQEGRHCRTRTHTTRACALPASLQMRAP